MNRAAIPLAVVPILILSGQQSYAPVPVALGVALKCVAISVIIPTAVIIYKCDQNFYLVGYKPGEGDDPWWECSKANPNTLKKLNGRRWEGPWKNADEPTARAWANNRNPSNPPFPMGPLGTIPSPNTNALRIVLEMSGGLRWSQMTSTTTDPDDNLSFVVFLTNGGTNGMTADQLLHVSDCDVAVTNTSASSSALFRLSGVESSAVMFPEQLSE